MKNQLTIKQENFCQAYIEAGNASEAYRRSYDTSRMKKESVHRKATELMDNVKITARIQTLQAEHKARHEVTVDTLTADAREAILLAKTEGQAGAFVSALNLIAKLHGLGIEKREVLNRLELPNDVNITLEAIARRADEGLG